MFENNNIICIIAVSTLVTVATANTPTHSDLLKYQKNSAPNHSVNPPHTPKHQGVNLEGLIEGSEILSNGAIWTVVPKDSILHRPSNHLSKVVARPRGKFVNWHTFLSRNPAWVSTYPVTLETSSGGSKISYENYEQLKNRGNIIVAVHRKDPISVTPQAIELTKP